MAGAWAMSACSGGADNATSGASDAAPTAAAPQPGEVTLAVAGLTGDAARGRAVFARCGACHSAGAGQNGVGPSLHGVFDRDAGKAPGFGYSPAMRNSGKHWDAATLYDYLEAPPMKLPGTRMMFVLTDPQDRADVIAYLSTLK